MRALWIEVTLFLALGLIGLVEGFGALGRKAFQSEPLTPAAYLMGISAMLCVATLVYLLVARKTAKTASGPARLSLGTETGLWATMVGYALVLPVVGYGLSTVAFFTLAFWVLRVRPWRRAALTAILFAGAFVLGFVVLANLLLPSGLVGALMDMFF